MSGHSKWEKIKRAKAGNDSKRGAVFTKLGQQIAIAARSGTDPSMNPALATVIETAKSANMPHSNIERAIQKAKDKSGVDLEEVMYEGYAQEGVALLIECATDNRKRTFPEVKSALSKNGGTIADPGSVAFQFERKGQIIVAATGDDAILKILDAGAEDAVEDDGEIYVYTNSSDLHDVRAKIVAAGLKVVSAELIFQPNVSIEVSDESAVAKIEKLIEALEDVDDVVNVHTNFEPVGNG